MLADIWNWFDTNTSGLDFFNIDASLVTEEVSDINTEAPSIDNEQQAEPEVETINQTEDESDEEYDNVEIKVANYRHDIDLTKDLQMFTKSQGDAALSSTTAF
ncbi:hypothetical protein Zmor_003735 [Zophobas morio]|uniref:Uncharacterized protein n=1 Tax=Zophobas morio TaxID=2755281 RepID=A0AA38HMH7_9CUCU|nr:hypothetical protein Zmor_003735 [Zophobas morio]